MVAWPGPDLGFEINVDFYIRGGTTWRVGSHRRRWRPSATGANAAGHIKAMAAIGANTVCW